jgi:hypothetical protein
MGLMGFKKSHVGLTEVRQIVDMSDIKLLLNKVPDYSRANLHPLNCFQAQIFVPFVAVALQAVKKHLAWFIPANWAMSLLPSLRMWSE